MQLRRLILLCLVYSAFADDRVQLSGLVQDVSGGVLVDVSVVAMDEETGIRRSVRSTSEGVYVLPSLPPGSYKITARKPGFRTVARVNVQVASGSNPRIDFVLPVGSIKETVTISGGLPLLNSYDGSVGTVAGRNWIESLPLNGRGIMSLLDLAPGVVATPASSGEAGQFSVNGQRPNTNYFAIDGVSANSGVSGSAVPAQFAGGTLPGMTAFGSTQNLVSLDALEEVRIQTSSFAPEFGRLPGAQVALTTRSGSDEFHGSLFHALRNEKLDANDWMANSQGYGRLPARLNQWGAALGGPIRAARTYFFSSYEALRLVQSYTWQMVTPSVESRQRVSADLRPVLDAFARPTGRDLRGGVAELTARAARSAALNAGSLRIDHALTSRVSLFGWYQQAPSSTEFGFSQIDHSDFASHRLTIGAMATVGANLTNDLRLGISRASAVSRWVPDTHGGAIPIDLRKYLPASGGADTNLYGIAIGGVGELVSGDSGRNSQGQLNLHEVFALNRGPHALRLGLDYDRLTPARVGAASSIAGSYASLADLMAGRPPLITRSLAEPASSLMETLSLFFQDTWQVTPRLALTYGLRWELTPPPSFRESRAAYSLEPTVTLPSFAPVPANLATVSSMWPIRYTQFAPRVGIAYRITPGSVLRAGWGLFYDLGFSAALDPINGFPFNRWQFTSGGPTTVSTVDGARFAPNLKLPHSRHWNIAWESAFSGSDAVSVSYVGSSGRQLLRREGAIVGTIKTAGATVATNHGASNYHALQTQYRRRLARGLQVNAGYTWSHSIDNGSWDSGLALVQENEGIIPSRDRGSSSFDVRHGFNAALSYQLRGWEIESMLRARTGFPIDVRDKENLLGLGFDNITRPDWNGVPAWIVDPGVPGGRRLNPAAFSPPTSAVQGNLGRNAIRGFGMSQLDLALKRSFSVGEHSTLEFRAEAFNALNHTNPADPVPYLQDARFGQSASMLNLMLGSGTPHSGLAPAFQMGGARSLQFVLRLRF